MHSNFITPPDIVRSILIVDATQEQAQALAEQIRGSEQPYNIYFYNVEMNNAEWLQAIILRADDILQSENSTIPIVAPTLFGEQREFKEPKDYFNK